jgi:hypothetical protein
MLHDPIYTRGRGTADSSARRAATTSGEEVVMRNLLLKGLGALTVVGVLTTMSVSAEALDVRAKVPFTFTVNKATLPPGTYSISTTGASTVILRGASGGGAVSLTQALEKADAEGAKLVFHRYGEEYVLREIWSGSRGHKLPESKREREMIARNGVASMQVVEVKIPTL